MSFATRDFWIGIVMLVVAAVYWWEAGKIRSSPLDDGIGAAGLPKTLAVTLGVLALILIARTLLASFLSRRKSVAQPVEKPAKDGPHPHWRAIGMLAIGVAFLLVLPYVGYALTVAALLLIASLYIGASFSVKTLLVAAIGGVAFHLLFVEFLGIKLPAGAIIGPFLGG